MAAKLGKSAYPAGHSPNDFKGFGPVVSKDTEWRDSGICDLGCFKQETVDSNKYYHLAVVQSTINQKYYAYFEWGRTRPDGRPNKPAYQFTECNSITDAKSVCEKQFKSKNTSRGQWQMVGSKERFVAKPGKDLYVVRVTATRLVGLPCVENIANEDAKGVVVATTTKVTKTKTKTSSIDLQTRKLFGDLIGGAVSYTNAVMSGGKGGKITLPAKAALDEGREVLDDAMDRIKIVGNDLNIQLKDAELKQLSYHLYGVIPRAKPQGGSESDWLLTQNNIATWRLDIDAFETALQAVDMNVEEDTTDVMAGIPAQVKYIPESDPIHEFLVGKWLGADKGHEGWWGKATRYQSGTGRSKLRIHHLWSVERNGDRQIIRNSQEKIQSEMPKSWNNERPMFHEKARPDLDLAEKKLYWNTNTSLLFHGTRSVNVPGIVRENFRFPKELKGTGISIAGAMFGGGTYYADDWSKSAGYCSSPHSRYGGDGSVKGRHSFMFACDVALGHPHVADGPFGYTAPPKGTHCVFGKAGHSRVQNNEWIIFHKTQSEIRYLAEISW